jgi:transaldolase
VTLIFSIERYKDVMDAYLKGLEQRIEQSLPVNSVASVASFFISRIDSNIDARLQKILAAGGSEADKAASLPGKAGIASARLAYEAYKEVFFGERFLKLAQKGARVQRPLWASTSTKNPAYRDVMYVEELIGPDTVNTMPPQTLAAFLDHGEVRLSIEDDLQASRQVLADLESLGISIQEVTQQLEDEGVKSFSDSFKVLLEVIEEHQKDLKE